MEDMFQSVPKQNSIVFSKLSNKQHDPLHTQTAPPHHQTQFYWALPLGQTQIHMPFLYPKNVLQIVAHSCYNPKNKTQE